MSSRGWTRMPFRVNYRTPNTVQPLTTTVIGFTPSNTANDTLVRVLLDINCTIKCHDTLGGGPLLDWWNQVNVSVAVGIDDTGLPNIYDLNALTDTRLTGTQMLYCNHMNLWIPNVNGRTALYTAREMLDVKGMRKPEVGGTHPAAAVVAQIDDDGSVITATNDWDVWYYGWIRALWETP